MADMLSDEELAAIRNRFKELADYASRLDLLDDEKRSTEGLQGKSWPCAWDVEPLLAEVDRLRAQRDKVPAAVAIADDADDTDWQRGFRGWHVNATHAEPTPEATP
jgi:hypothetical protein